MNFDSGTQDLSTLCDLSLCSFFCIKEFTIATFLDYCNLCNKVAKLDSSCNSDM